MLYLEEVFAKLSVDDGGVVGQRVFIMAWTDVSDFFALMYGAYTNNSGQTVVTAPQHWPGIPSLYVRGLDAEPQDPSSPAGNQSYQQITSNQVVDFTLPTFPNQGYTGKPCGARVTVIYRPFAPNGTPDGKPSVPAGTFLDFESESTETALPVPGRYLKWASDSVVLPHDVTAPVPIYNEEIRLTWHRVTQPPFSAMSKLKGCVNENSFCNHGQQRVIYLGGTVSQEFQIGNTILYTVAHRFRAEEKPGTLASGAIYGPNFMYRKDVGAGTENWQLVKNQGSGQVIFPYDTDQTTNGFEDLFSYGP
jgi:hypothetical protein